MTTESVWDYPRPPVIDFVRPPFAAARALDDVTGRRVRVQIGGHTLADTTRALRVLETSHPPTIYLPPEDVRMDLLAPVGRSSFCEWKGNATYFDVVAGDRVERAAAWTYRSPVPRYAALKDFVSVYPGRMDACFLDDERVEAQPGDFYGGWITADITGPFKGAPGTRGW